MPESLKSRRLSRVWMLDKCAYHRHWLILAIDLGVLWIVKYVVSFRGVVVGQDTAGLFTQVLCLLGYVCVKLWTRLLWSYAMAVVVPAFDLLTILFNTLLIQILSEDPVDKLSVWGLDCLKTRTMVPLWFRLSFLCFTVYPSGIGNSSFSLYFSATESAVGGGNRRFRTLLGHFTYTNFVQTFSFMGSLN